MSYGTKGNTRAVEFPGLETTGYGCVGSGEMGGVTDLEGG